MLEAAHRTGHCFSGVKKLSWSARSSSTVHSKALNSSFIASFELWHRCSVFGVSKIAQRNRRGILKLFTLNELRIYSRASTVDQRHYLKSAPFVKAAQEVYRRSANTLVATFKNREPCWPCMASQMNGPSKNCVVRQAITRSWLR
jgi:hypothetical protein